MNMQEIGFKISELRKQRDMTQLELADKMGVSYQAVSSWERGATMPDISRLPDISQVLGVSIDELLGNSSQAEIVKKVLTQQTDAYTPDNMPPVQDLAEVAPILKPSQVDQLMEKTSHLSISDLTGFAPFLSKAALGQLAINAENIGDINSLCGLSPFLDKDVLNQLARRIDDVNGLCALTGLAPFISSNVLGELALKAVDGGHIENLCGIAPFLEKNIIDQLAFKAEVVENIGVLTSLAPFISKEALYHLAIKAVDAGDMHELYQLAPFLDTGMLDQIVLKAAEI